MGFLRGSLLGFIGLLLFITLLAGNLALILSTSINHEAINSKISPVINENILDQIPEDAIEIMEEVCENASNYSFEQGELNFSLFIPCEVVSEGREKVINYSVENFLDKIYYDSYECGFWSCVTSFKYPFVLISEKAKDYWMNKFCLLLIASLILAGLSFLLNKSKLNFLLMFGSLIIASAIPLKFLESIITFFLPSIFESFALLFVSTAGIVFVYMLMIGILLVVSGITFKILKIRNIADRFIKKDSKDKK